MNKVLLGINWFYSLYEQLVVFKGIIFLHVQFPNHGYIISPNHHSTQLNRLHGF